MNVSESLKRTPLFDEHVALKAKLVPFGGWEMPVQYEGIIAEYDQTRKCATLFDTCHMGEFWIEGDPKSTGLDRIVTMPLQDMDIKTCRYGFLLNESAGTIDDLIVFRIEKDQWFVVVNGATTEKDRDHFLKNLELGAVFKDISEETGKIDLQGPKSREVLSALVPEIKKLEYYTFDYFTLLGEKALISRTGYTGELGYEIYCHSGKIKDVWRTLLKNDLVKPAGLGARDVLRLEVGYPLYGHELSETISPVEAGLKKFVDFNKDFIGKSALLEIEKNAGKQRLIGFVSENRRSPRGEQKIYSSDKKEIGFVTSGTFSPHLGRGIGVGYVKGSSVEKGTKVFIGDERQNFAAEVTGRIFYQNGSLKN